MKQHEDGTDYRVLRQKDVRMTWRAINYEKLDHATKSARKYFDLVDGVRCDPDEEDIWQIKDDENRLFNEPDCTLDELWPSISENVSDSVLSVPDIDETS